MGTGNGESGRDKRRLARKISATTVPGQSSVGGGAFPEADLPTTLVVIPAAHPDNFLTALRRHDPPVIARAGDGAVLLDVRTLRDDEFDTVAAATAAAVA